MKYQSSQKGFTLVEILIAMALVAFLAMLSLDMFAPFMLLKSKMDTERKMTALSLAISEAYKRNPMRIDDAASAKISLDSGDLTSSVKVSGTGGYSCDENSSFIALKSFISSGVHDGQSDGFGSPFCIHVSNRIAQAVDGTTLYYHNVAIISPGSDQKVTSVFDPVTGELEIKDDDYGSLISGFAIQHDLYRLSQTRLDKVGDLYASYFTSRYLANPARDISVNYFSKVWDTTGSIESTSSITGNVDGWSPVRISLATLGANDLDSRTPYEDTGAIHLSGKSNDIFVANHSSCVPLTSSASCPVGTASSVDCLCVRSPASGAIPPYTIILGAKLPGGSYITKSVAGHY